jgi:hypothetical protein
VRVSVGGHLTDLKIWLFAGSEEGKNIKINVRKSGKSFHITNLKLFSLFTR